MIDSATLRTFLAVVEEGGFSRASTILGRTQPAVSLAVRRLEEELGEVLIDRSSRELLLTDSGRLILEFGRRFHNLDREMKRALQELRNLSAGRLLIGANESSTLYLLQHLTGFRARFPKVRVQIQRSHSSEIPAQLLSGDLELGVISYEPNLADLAVRVIYIDHLAFVVSPQHRLANKASVSIEELGTETFIAHNVVSPYRRTVLERFQRHRVPLNMDVEMPTVESIRRLVQRNEGVAFLPRMCVDQEIQAGSLREVAVPQMRLERRIRMVYSRKRKLSRAAVAFLELLGETTPAVDA